VGDLQCITKIKNYKRYFSLAKESESLQCYTVSDFNQKLESQVESWAQQNQSKKNQTDSFSSNSVFEPITYDPVKTTLSELEAEE